MANACPYAFDKAKEEALAHQEESDSIKISK
jgi:hypothetical protein